MRIFGPTRLTTATTLLLAVLAVGCGSTEKAPAAAPSAGPSTAATTPGPTASPTAPVTRRVITIAGNRALTWGTGPYGVVLAHGRSYDAASWNPQGPKIAALGTTVIAVEEITPAAITDAVAHLRAAGITKVALVGGSAGADAILQVVTAQPGIDDQLVLLSPNQTVEGLGGEPKLFIASEDEPNGVVAAEMADSAPGADNELKIVPGTAHAQQILKQDDGTILRLVLDRLRSRL